MEQMLSFTPDLETPKYDVVNEYDQSNGLKLAWEVRASIPSSETAPRARASAP